MIWYEIKKYVICGTYYRITQSVAKKMTWSNPQKYNDICQLQIGMVKYQVLKFRKYWSEIKLINATNPHSYPWKNSFNVCMYLLVINTTILMFVDQRPRHVFSPFHDHTLVNSIVINWYIILISAHLTKSRIP